MAAHSTVSTATDLWVFRDVRKVQTGAAVVGELQHRLALLLSHPADKNRCMDALIAAGEFESGMADGGRPLEWVPALTDSLAWALYTRDFAQTRTLAAKFQGLRPPEQLAISPPEGFSYYALDPLRFAGDVVAGSGAPGPVAVIGVRSIGTTLSAVCRAALRMRNIAAERITVRPTGHPYSRNLRLSNEEKLWVQRMQKAAALFVVVDEGPGRSGSTFLSVGEALVEAGVPAGRIILAGSREPELNELCAQEAAARWQRFRFVCAGSGKISEFAGQTYIGGGRWREFLLNGTAWPGCWPQMERTKFLSDDHFTKYEGLGKAGKTVRERAAQLARNGYAPAADEAENGFVAYRRLQGRPLQTGDISPGLLERMAQYCAFRAAEFRTSEPATDLRPMVEHNLRREFGMALPKNVEERKAFPAIIVDGRMQPHEWLQTRGDVFLKTDGASHGDDHFFPGPTEVTWDLAGIAVEWELSPHAVQQLLASFRRLSGEDVRKSFAWFELAYSVFRTSWCRMAIPTVSDQDEMARLVRDLGRYRGRCEHLLSTTGRKGRKLP